MVMNLILAVHEEQIVAAHIHQGLCPHHHQLENGMHMKVYDQKLLKEVKAVHECNTIHNFLL